MTSCSKEARLMGTWECESAVVVLPDGSEISASAAEAGVNVTLIFKGEGKVDISQNIEGVGFSIESTYTDETINLMGRNCEYELDGDTLRIKTLGSISDNEGTMTLIFKKK